MEPELISKKDLLEEKGISYGQLYRWKRMNLIPEDWFIKKSSFTGQETFFPKEKILTRIDRIISMKEDSSLGDLADIFSPSEIGTQVALERIADLEIASQATLDFSMKSLKIPDPVPFPILLVLFITEKMFASGNLNQAEAKDLLKTLMDNSAEIGTHASELVFLRKLGVPVFLLTKERENLLIDSAAKIVSRLSIPSCVEELRIKIK